MDVFLKEGESFGKKSAASLREKCKVKNNEITCSTGSMWENGYSYFSSSMNCYNCSGKKLMIIAIEVKMHIIP